MSKPKLTDEQQRRAEEAGKKIAALAWASPPSDAEVIADLEQKLAAMVDERLASLERRVDYLLASLGNEGLSRRVDLLYRYTVGDRTGRHTLVPNMHQRGDEFPEAEP